MKTLEEVKEYFKGVEIAKCVATGKEFKFSEADDRGIHYDQNSYWIVSSAPYMVYYQFGDQFSEIISKPQIYKYQYKSGMDRDWQDFPESWEIRVKPDYSKEIAELERQIQELKNR